MNNYGDYKPTIGIECHVQLATKTKLFTGANNDARDQKPNTTISPICLGLPGTLPILNKEAVTLALRAGIALKSDMPLISRFERKHYFYPDLPKGYQTTQLAEPVIGPGTVSLILDSGESTTVRIHHAHLEEDAGKLTHPAGADYSLVDLNRAGTPLIEIVSEPDIASPAEARAFAEELFLLMTYADVTYGDLFHGNMRFDVNVSVSKTETLGKRTETKNLNSFRSVEKAAEYEIKRQIDELNVGREIVQETRGWDEAKQKTVSQRGKEDAHDYRYFPDADIPPIVVTPKQIETARNAMPVLPDAYREAWRSLNLSQSVIDTLLGDKKVAQRFGEIHEQLSNEASKVAHWIASALDSPQKILLIDTKSLVELVQMVSDNELSSTSAKEVLVDLQDSSKSARDIATDKNLIQSNDTDELESHVEVVLANPASQKAIEDIKSGNEKAIGYLVGQVMKASKGSANPAMVKDIIKKQLEK